MKTILFSLVFGVAILSSSVAQTVTNITIRAIIKLSDGTSITNSVSNSNAAIFAAATNSMVKFNLVGESKDPPRVATTNLSNFFIEQTKEQFNLIKNEYDYRMSQDLNIKLQSLSEAQKDAIRALINAP